MNKVSAGNSFYFSFFVITNVRKSYYIVRSASDNGDIGNIYQHHRNTCVLRVSTLFLVSFRRFETNFEFIETSKHFLSLGDVGAEDFYMNAPQFGCDRVKSIAFQTHDLHTKTDSLQYVRDAFKLG